MDLNSIKKVIFVLLFSNGFFASAQIYKDATKATSERVTDLLHRMTWEEKCWQLFMIPGDTNLLHGQLKQGVFGLQVSAASAGDVAGQGLRYERTQPASEQLNRINQLQKYCVEQTRLGIPMLPFDEALHGLVRQGATSFPQAIGLAATWDLELVQEVATHISYETKERGIKQILSPVVNLANDVRWGRTEETYGEDPYLSALMGVSFMRSFEENGIITTPKHFIANVGDGGRDSYPISMSNWYLERTHLIPFEKAIKEAKSRSIMSAYNSLNGQACSSNNWLLTEKLKNDWKFDGFVISDANAVGGALVLHRTAPSYVSSGVQAINAGLDVIFQTDVAHFPLFFPEFPPQGMDTNRINDAVSRVLKAKFNLGLFEHPYTKHSMNADSLLTAGHALAQKAAEEAVVLLKNKADILPLGEDIKKIAVFGEDAILGRLGGYSGPGNQVTTILDGIRIGFPQTQVSYEMGAALHDTSVRVLPVHYITMNGNPGFHAEYFDNPQLAGNPVLRRRDAQIDFHWTLYGPNNEMNPHFYSVRWTGELQTNKTEHLELGLEGNDGYRMYINDSLCIDRWEKRSYHQDFIAYTFDKNRRYSVRVEFKESQGNGKIKFIYKNVDQNNADRDIQKVEKLSQKADVNIVVVGIEEGEFNDRASLRLSDQQEKLIQTVAEKGKKTIVLLVGGSAIHMESWIEAVDGIFVLWYPGEAGGIAISRILNGSVNPSGKLPITYPMNEAQLPLVYNHLPSGRGDDYRNLSGEPLFPFGFGLSYTQFDYTEQKQETKNPIFHIGESAQVHFTISNAGKYQGTEIAQCYLKRLNTNEIAPVQELIQFQRVLLNSNESKDLVFTFELKEDLSPFGLAPGAYELQIGSSSKDIRILYPFRIE